MAERRMFAKTIVESDMFYSLSIKAQCLYFHLCMSADDDGFMNNALLICKSLGFPKSVLEELINRRYLLDCGDGITCVKHWRVSNTISKDRYKPTIYQEQLEKLSVKDNKSYTDKNVYKTDTKPIQKNDNTETQISIGKYRLDKYRDDDIQIYNARLIESGIGKDIIDKAMGWLHMCHISNDMYLKIIDVLQNDEIIDKDAYINRMVRNEQDRQVYA